MSTTTRSIGRDLLRLQVDAFFRDLDLPERARAVVVAADALAAGLTLTGSASAGERRSLGSAMLDDGEIRPERGFYSAGLEVDLPWERTAERNIYRDSYINLERSVRNLQDAEDSIKLDIRDGLRDLLESRQSYQIQAIAVQLAERRVESNKLFLEAGREALDEMRRAGAHFVTGG